MYEPKPGPTFADADLQRLADYIKDELNAVQQSQSETSTLELRVLNTAPEKPREGMIVAADGSNWNPGEGKGTYKFESGAWVKMADAVHTHLLTDIIDAGALAALDKVTLSDMATTTPSRILASDGSGVIEASTLSAVLDFIGSAARGDILARGASTWARLAIGADGTTLNSDGTDPSWSAPTWLNLIEAAVNTGQDTVIFNDIPTGYNHLVIIGHDITWQSSTQLIPDFSEATTFASALTYNVSGITWATGGGLTGHSFRNAYQINPGASYNTGTPGDFIGFIFDVAGSESKLCFFISVTDTGSDTQANIGLYRIISTAPIRSMQMASFVAGRDWLTGSMTLYGIK